MKDVEAESVRWSPNRAPEPTTTIPGTLERIACYRARIERGEQLFHEATRLAKACSVALKNGRLNSSWKAKKTSFFVVAKTARTDSGMWLMALRLRRQNNRSRAF